VTPLLSTNPLTIGIPRPGQAPLILDMATSAGTFSQVMMAQRDHTPLPAGVAVDPQGHPTIDPFKAVDEANRPHLLPFGGYKGFGIELMIELLCDACLGTPSGKSKLRAGLDPIVDNGLYLAFLPDLFVERAVFDAQVSQLIADLHDSSKGAGSSEVRLPGEESQQRKAALLRTGTIEIEELLYEFLLAP
jgi:LDH2 family malate/lactate/ureidoglycolate dehydrogenase